MAYEYNPESGRFEVPNPHRVENLFLAISAVACIGLGLLALIEARGAYSRYAYESFWKALLVAGVLLMSGFGFGVSMLRQLRFYFGRGQPTGLAEELAADQQGASPEAQELRNVIRQNAINYPVPKGALNNLLYSLVKDLVFCPLKTRELAEAVFQSLIGFVFILLCFLVSMVGVRSGAALSWIGFFYFALSVVLILRPLMQHSLNTVSLSPGAAIVFIAFSIVGPVVVSAMVPRDAYLFYDTIHFVPVTLAIQGSAIGVSLLLLRATVAQTIRPSRIASAPHLETPSLNASPTQLFIELAREMQRLWVETIPNRTYLRILPQLDGPGGPFEGHLIEETQPLPQDLQPLTLARALELDACRWLVLMDAFCTLLTIVGAAMLVHGVLSPRSFGAQVAGASLLVVAGFGLTAGSRIWRRFEFKSRIYWIEAAGTFTRAETEVGAMLRDRVRTTRGLINVETMTLRVWVAEVDSIAFDTVRAPSSSLRRRWLVALRGLPDEADRLCRHLCDFGRNQASVIAPTSEVDQQRLAILRALNSKNAPEAPLSASAGLPQPPAAAALPGQRFCSQCGIKAEPGAVFCAGCGVRLGPGPS